ncbi:uncharacterized protein LOC117648498 [Thrips palmi]|uniref:Uncharacterized protein LOC117648498 n=1 Tax=Thrips palmi TaxID=161013 RepID=A0A6P8Z926_THRPL|nr:uncharacterized protein LOC117648498 [Thrips palmi]
MTAPQLSQFRKKPSKVSEVTPFHECKQLIRSKEKEYTDLLLKYQQLENELKNAFTNRTTLKVELNKIEEECKKQEARYELLRAKASMNKGAVKRILEEQALLIEKSIKKLHIKIEALNIEIAAQELKLKNKVEANRKIRELLH